MPDSLDDILDDILQLPLEEILATEVDPFIEEALTILQDMEDVCERTSDQSQ